jgi:hypothetical protein
MKKVFLLGVATLIFAYQASFASKNGEFTFGIDKILAYQLNNSIDYVDGKKVETKRTTTKINGKEKEIEEVRLVDNVLRTVGSKDYGRGGFAPKLEYCYYVLGQEKKGRMGVGLGVNKFFNSDFDPFNVYAIWKTVLPPINDKYELSFGMNLGYGILNNKYKTAKETFKADTVYSAKFFVKFEYKNFSIDLSAMTNIIPINAKIKTVNEGVKHLEENISYNVIMLGIGYKFAI